MIQQVHESSQWSIRKGVNLTTLPLPELSAASAKVDTFIDHPTSLKIVGRVADNNNIWILTKDEVIVHHEEDVLITYKG